MNQTRWITLAVFVVVLVWWLIWKSNWRPKGLSLPTLPSTDGFQEKWGSWWTNGKLLPILVCFTLIHLSIYKLAPNFWMSQAWGEEWSRRAWFWGIQIAIGIATGVKKANPSKPIKHRLSAIATILLVLTFIIHLGGWDIEGQAKSLLENQTPTTATMVGVNLERRPIVTLEKDPCIEDDSQHGPDKEKANEALVDYPFLFALACRETRFNHANPEDPTKVFVGKEDEDDTGIMQINKRIHKDLLEEKGLNADVFEDNIAFAKFLYDKKGIDHWFPLVSGRRYDPITVIVVASKDTWSPVVKIPTLTSGAEFKTIKPVLAEIDGREVIFDPKVDHHWGSVKQIRFKSIDGAKTTIRITFNFWPVP